MLNVILFGPPGAGKGTQSKKIIDKYNLVHISTGEILRSEIANQTPCGLIAQREIDKGRLAPDDLVIAIISHKLDECKHWATGFVFDGFPRTTNQAREFDRMLRERNTSVTLMLGLEVEQTELQKRLENRAKLENRVDDSSCEIIKNRIRIYNETTIPVMCHYSEQGKYFGVDGMGSVDDIFQRIAESIEQSVANQNRTV